MPPSLTTPFLLRTTTRSFLLRSTCLPRFPLLIVGLFAHLFISTAVVGQPVGRLRGIVTDSTTGQPLPLANVALQGTTIGTVTTVTGYFQLAGIPPGDYRILFTHLGHTATVRSASIEAGQITEVRVALVPVELRSDEVVVTGERPKRIDETQLQMQSISAKEIRMVPAGAEPDIFRALQSSPGVGTTSDISARYYVRGGASDQNLVLLNGATIYSPFHTLGIFSVVEPEVVSIVEFHKSAFPPSYGGRLSSILNIVTRDGNRNEMQANVAASLLSGKFILEGPVPGGSFLVQGRKSWHAAIIRKYLNEQEAPFDFYDGTWKVTIAHPSIDRNSRFSLHGFASGDEVVNEDPAQEDYGIRNRVYGLQWHKIWSSPLFSTVSISSSGFKADVRPNRSSAKPRANTVNDLSASWDFTYLFDTRDELMFGLQNKSVSTSLELENLFGHRYVFRQHGTDVSAYFDYRAYRWDRISVSAGLRFLFVALAKIRPGLFEPRASLTYKPAEWLTLRTAAGFYSQEMMTVADESELVSVFEPWIIVPDYLFTPSAFQASAGMKFDWLNVLSTEVEAYVKPIRKVAIENPTKLMPSDRDLINVNTTSWGIEALTQYTSIDTYARVSYAFSRVTSNVLGRIDVPRYDIRHALGILVGFDLGDHWRASVSWMLRSGMPFTPIAGFADRLVFDPWEPPYDDGPSEPMTLWGRKNSVRLPIYHRMDMSLSWDFTVGGIDATAGLTIINLYDRKNVFYFERITGRAIYMLRFFPSVSLQVTL